MKVMVAGITGFIGSALARRLRRDGHEVIGLSRRPEAGNERWDGVNPGPWVEALRGCDAVVNLAGESVVSGRWTAAKKKAIHDSRVLSTRAIVSALQDGGPRVLINASAVGFYGSRGSEALTESSAPGSDFLARVCADWEKEALLAAGRVACMRLGMVLDRSGGALAKMLPPFKLGLGGPLGSGKQWVSWVLLDDAVDLIVHLLRGDLAGPVNAVSPEPVMNEDFARVMGRVLRRPAVAPAPAFALRLAFGEMADALLLASQKAVPAKALKDGFLFKHASLDAALKKTLA